MRYLRAFVALPVLAVAAACAPDAPTEPSTLVPDEALFARAGDRDHRSSAVHQLLAEVRRATVRYHDLNAARADGYVRITGCVPGMGFHFAKPTLVDRDFDPLQPEVLVYAPRDKDKLALVAVEYLSFAEERPAFGGVVPFEDFEHGAPNFALHAWIWKGNPEGVFRHSNPTVSCPDGGEHH